MTEVILTFDMIRFNDETGDCIALLNGKETIVDPYVGCVWYYPYFKTGEITFEGHWYHSENSKERVFLPSRQLSKDQLLCISCRKKLL